MAVCGAVRSAGFPLDVMAALLAATVDFSSDFFFFFFRGVAVSPAPGVDAAVAFWLPWWVFDERPGFGDAASEEFDGPSSAAAIAGLLAIAAPIPSATANPATLPMNRP